LSAYSTIISFTIFAFLTNLIREINKDCEDKEGDEASGILTFATALGYKKADLVSQTFTVFLFIAAIIWLLLKNIPSNIVELTVYLFIVLFPIIFLYWTLTNQERNKAKYTSVSNNLKLIMVLGLIYLLVHLNMNYA
jgi:4-hydroxybenzoate polyprenyltransferase